MAIELYRNPDGSVGGLDAGKVMVAPTQEEFEDCCCEAIVPCADCCGEYVQDSAVVTVTGTCAGFSECEEHPGWYICHCAAGTYTFADCVASLWTWNYTDVNGQPWVLELLCCDRVGVAPGWCARLSTWGMGFGLGANCAPCGVEDWINVTTEVSCNPETHKLSGSFDLSGFGSESCQGCTAHVTL